LLAVFIVLKSFSFPFFHPFHTQGYRNHLTAKQPSPESIHAKERNHVAVNSVICGQITAPLKQMQESKHKYEAVTLFLEKLISQSAG